MIDRLKTVFVGSSNSLRSGFVFVLLLILVRRKLKKDHLISLIQQVAL